jgi:membrane peptidoglycan carboxypeptidase
MAQVTRGPAAYDVGYRSEGYVSRGYRANRGHPAWPRRIGGLGLAVTAGGLAAVVALWVGTPDAALTAGAVRSLAAGEHAHVAVRLPSPDRVGQALIATEDSRFRTGIGVDPRGVARAVISPLIGRGDQGGATLEQQLAKMAFPQQSAGLLGKARDVVLALKIDRTYTKDQVLQMYLNAAYFGHGYYGIQDAARGYFGLSPSQLSWGQASMLAGLVQAPSLMDPLVHPAAARVRQGHVLDRLVATGVLTRTAADAAARAPLGLRR